MSLQVAGVDTRIPSLVEVSHLAGVQHDIGADISCIAPKLSNYSYQSHSGILPCLW